MATNKELLSKSIKYLAWSLPLLFIGPSLIYNAFINKQNDWHYLDDVDRHRLCVADGECSAYMDHRVLLCSHWGWHHVWWLAHCANHGAKNHQAQAGRGLLCGDRRRFDTVSCNCIRRAGLHHAHHYRGDCGCGFNAARERGALGCGRKHRVGVGADDSCRCIRCSYCLLGQSADFLTSAVGGVLWLGCIWYSKER